MTARTLPTLPGCGRAATVRIEVYSPADGRAHGSLDATTHACADHADEAVTAIREAGLTAHRMPAREAARCGQGFNFLTGQPIAAPAGPPTEHPKWCAPSHCADGVHQAEPVHIRENLLAVLRQKPNQPPRVALEFWDDPDDAEPTELILLDLTDAALLSDTLTRLADLAWGDQS